MGAPKLKWTSEEEEALRAGVEKHGAGKWRAILIDPQFSAFLSARSNIDLKDKWRNLSVTASGQGSRDRSRRLKIASSFGQSNSTPNSATASCTRNVSQTTATNSSKKTEDGKTPLSYTKVVFEALSELQDPNGSDVNSICKFVQQRHPDLPNLRKSIGAKLRRLIAQDKVEKVNDLYKIKDSAFAVNTPSPKQLNPIKRLRSTQNVLNRPMDLEETAYRIAEAEVKSFLASEAVKEAERVSLMAEDTDSMLQLANEIFERCARGEIVSMA